MVPGRAQQGACTELAKNHKGCFCFLVQSPKEESWVPVVSGWILPGLCSS